MADDFPDEFEDKRAYFYEGCGDIRISFCQFIECHSTSSTGGGGILIEQLCKVEIHGCIFDRCYTTLHGGACAIAKKTLHHSHDDPDLDVYSRTLNFVSKYNCFQDCYLDNPRGFGLSLIIASEEITMLYSSTINNFMETAIWGANMDLLGNNILTKYINLTGSDSIYCGGIEYRETKFGVFQFHTLSYIRGKYIIAVSAYENERKNFNISMCNIFRNKILDRDLVSRTNPPAFIFYRYSDMIVDHFYFYDNERPEDGQIAISVIDNHILFWECYGNDFDAYNTDYPYATFIECDFHTDLNHTLNFKYLNYAGCQGVLTPGPYMLTPSFTESLTFTRSLTFSLSDSFTHSEKFTQSSVFTQSSAFTLSYKFDQTKSFTLSRTFTATNSFSHSKIFTHSDFFSETDHFSLSDFFSHSDFFKETDIFSASNYFTHSIFFNPTDNFKQTDFFTNSNFFSSTDIFSLSDFFSHSDFFKETDIFSASNYFIHSIFFNPTDNFKQTDFFTNSNFFSSSDHFTHSIIFNQSNHFTHSKPFSDSLAFTFTEIFSPTQSLNRSATFTPSSNFSHSSLFSQSCHFSNSIEFTFSNTFSDTPTSSAVGRVISSMKSASITFLLVRSVSMSISQFMSNILSFTYISEIGGYSAILLTTQVYKQFPYLIQFYSPTMVETVFFVELNTRKNKLSSENLIGIVCGSIGVFFGILGVIILAKKKSISSNDFDDLDDSTSNEENETKNGTNETTKENQVSFDIPDVNNKIDFDDWL